MLGRLNKWFRRRNDEEIAAYRQHISWLRAYNARILAKYDSAATDPEKERYWSQVDSLGPRSANDKTVRQKLRDRSRYECRESNSYAMGMLLTKQNDVIGTGPMLQVMTEDDELNSIIEQKYATWAKRINLARKFRVLHGAKISDGEGFGQRTFNDRSIDENKVDILRTEADLWTNPEWTGEDEREVDGITYDPYGNPVEYQRLRHHPGDHITWTTDPWATDSYAPEDVIHWFREDRPDQRRGIPEFTPALALFAELRRYRLAVISAAEIAADFAGVMFSDAPAFGEDPTELEDDLLKIDLERRALLTLPHGWKMQQLRAEQPTTEFSRFTEAILAEIGRAVQMPLNLVSGSSREYNFASGRLDYLLYWSHCDIERHDFGCQVAEKVFAWWLDEALLIPGYLPRLGSIREIPHEWIWPPRRPIDEESAAKADLTRFQMGHLTDQAWAKREQIDLQRHYEELREMVRQREAMGITVPLIPGTQDVTNNDQEEDQGENTAAASE